MMSNNLGYFTWKKITVLSSKIWQSLFTLVEEMAEEGVEMLLAGHEDSSDKINHEELIVEMKI